MRRLLTALAAALLGLVALVVPGVAHAATTSSMRSATIPPPDSDPFYTPSAGFASTAPGTVLRSRPVSVPELGAVSSAQYQLLYRTTNPGGEAVAAVTTLMIPRVPALGTRNLVSYQTAEDSLTTMCAPSYTLQTNANGETVGMGPLLASGWDVVVPDYEGPQSEYAVGTMAGMATLDSIRAVEHFTPGGLEGAVTPVGLEGYSGGSIPSTWANALQPSYAPELHLVAPTAGGIAADPSTVLASENGGPAFGEVIAAAIGIDRAYPQFDLGSLLNAQGKALEQKVATDSGGCGSGITSAPFGTVAEYTNYATPQALLAVPRVKSTIAKLDLITRPAPVHNPMFYFQEIFDEFLPASQVDQLNAAYCKEGATVDYVRGVTGEHLLGVADYFPRAFVYLQGRFAGLPAPDTCPSGVLG